MRDSARGLRGIAACAFFLTCGSASANSISVECANDFNNAAARFAIDFDNRTVDGNPASISDSTITWKTAGQVGGSCRSNCGFQKFWSIDRARGTIHAYFQADSGMRFPDDNYHGCQKVDAPQNRF